jgi:predicted CopG family antitoxin
MKATIDIPDDLYRRLKAKSALEGRSVRAVVVDLVEGWVEGNRPVASRSPDQWLEDWFRLADEAMKNAPPGPSAREILEEDRNRLERR